jgi:hypothetical protein
VQELKGLLQYLWPLVLLVVVALLRAYFGQSARGPQDEGPGIPSEAPAPAGLHPAHRVEVTSAEGLPELPQEPEASRGPQRKGRAPDPPPVAREPAALDAGRRLRRLVAHAEGRRAAFLAHEVFRPPEGCGRA